MPPRQAFVAGGRPAQAQAQALVLVPGLGSVPAQALGWGQAWAQALVSGLEPAWAMGLGPAAQAVARALAPGRGWEMASARVQAWEPAAVWAQARAPGSEWALAGGSGLATGRPLAGFAARRPARAPVLGPGWGRALAACPAQAGPHPRPRRRRRPG